MFDLTGKIALVTGAGSGIGAAIASTLAQAGAFVWVADLNEAGGRDSTRRILDAGGKTDFLRLDVASPQQATDAVAHVETHSGHLDILVNNAGIGHVGTALTTTAEDLDRLHQVNTRGPFNLSRAALPRMIERHSGSIINLASVGGLVGIRDRLAYCTSKFAVVGLTKAMALDHAHQGVRINCICPGRVETPFVTARLQEYPDPVKAREEMTSSQPSGRMGQPGEIAAAALYLASDEAAFITGTALSIDGGWFAG